MTQNSMSLRQVCATLDLSSVWVRRQLSKQIGRLGESAFKDDEGHWRVPNDVVESERERLELKRQKYDQRKRGELPKYYNVYTPDRVKSPLIVMKMLNESEYQVDDKLKTQMIEILTKMNQSENDKWTERKKKKNKKK